MRGIDTYNSPTWEASNARTRALRACAIAAAAVADPSLSPRRMAEILMESHGELMAAHGPGRFPSFSAFRCGLHAPVDNLLPGSGEGIPLGITLLGTDGDLHPEARSLVLEADDDVETDALGLAAEVAQLRGVFQASARTGIAGGARRVLPELVQHAVFMALRQLGKDGYQAARQQLIRKPVLPVRSLRRDHALTTLEVYGPISRSGHDQGWWAPCPRCGWPMTVEHRRATRIFSCSAHRRDMGAEYILDLNSSDRILHPRMDGLVIPELRRIEDWRAVPYPVWRYITVPGLLELDLVEDLTALGAEVEPWPYSDLYDLDVRVGLGFHRRVDVKVWASPHALVAALTVEPDQPADTIVVPDDQDRYVPFLQDALRACGLTVWTAAKLRGVVMAAVGASDG